MSNRTHGDSVPAPKLLELGVIELYDSDEHEDVKDVVLEETRKRRHETLQAHPKPGIKLKGEEEPESSVLSATSRRKQRKLNHAGAYINTISVVTYTNYSMLLIEQQDVKWPVGSIATSESHYRMRYNLHEEGIVTVWMSWLSSVRHSRLYTIGEFERGKGRGRSEGFHIGYISSLSASSLAGACQRRISNGE